MGSFVKSWALSEFFCVTMSRWPCERADAHGWAFVRQSREGADPQEWLARVEQWSYRAGCVVEVSKGRVRRTRFAELPR